MTPYYWQAALRHLSQQDTHLAGLIKRFPDLVLQSRENAFLTLIRSVVGQQISVSAADSVWHKLLLQFGTEFDYQAINNSTIDELKHCGLSAQKAGYLRNIAQYFSAHNIDADYWQQRDYDSIYNDLIKIKGVGNWTLEMFGIFYLLEADILPKKDLGLLRAIEKLYKYNKNSLTSKQIDKITNKWRPYRTVATWFLWRSIDSKTVTY